MFLGLINNHRLFDGCTYFWTLVKCIHLLLHYIIKVTEYQRLYKVQLVNCCHLKLLVLCNYFIWFKFCLQCHKLKSGGHCLWGKPHHDAIHSSRNLKMACCIASSKTKILEYVPIWGQILIHIDKNQTLSLLRLFSFICFLNIRDKRWNKKWKSFLYMPPFQPISGFLIPPTRQE